MSADEGLGGRFINGLGAWRGEGVKVCLDVIASEAKQSISPRKGRMDCFAALAMTARALDCFAPLAMTAGALESRSLSPGAHSRDPFASRNDEWGNRFSDNGDVTIGPLPIN